MAEIFLDHKNQANFSFSNKRTRYFSRNSDSNSSLILALGYMQPWRYRDIIHTHPPPPASWHTECKTTLLLRHAISMLQTKIQVEYCLYLVCPFQLKSYFHNLLITYIFSWTVSADPNFISHYTKSLSHSPSTQEQTPNLREGKDKGSLKSLCSLIHSLVV